MTPERRLWLLLQRHTAHLSPELSAELLRAYAEIEQILGAPGLEQAIRDGRIDQLIAERLSEANLDRSLGSVRAQVQETFREAMRLMARQVPGVLAESARAPGISFDVLNPRIIDAIRGLDSRVMQDLKGAIRDTVRQEAQAGLEAGLNPRVVARGVRESLGLSPRSANAVRNFRAELEAGDRSALRRVLAKDQIRRPDGSTISRSGHAGSRGLTPNMMDTLRGKLGTEPLTEKHIDTMVEAYRRRLTAWEAEAVSRSATGDALRMAHRLNWERAIELGVVDRALLVKERVVVDDGREREEHRRLRGQIVHFDSPYDNGEIVSGDSSYGCRCVDRYRVARSIEQRDRWIRESAPELREAA